MLARAKSEKPMIRSTVPPPADVVLPGFDRLREPHAALAVQVCQPVEGEAARVRSLGVTSCYRQEGASTTAAGLAEAAARLLDRPVLLVDANVQHPSVAKTFEVEAGPGLLEVIAGSIQPLEAIRPTRLPALLTLTAGAESGGKDITIDPAIFREVMQRLVEAYVLVVVDLPACEENTQAIQLASSLDGVLLVVEAERVHTHVAKRVKQQLEQAGAELRGVVLNKRPEYVPGWLYRTW